jgi:HD superfamily phosphodiesterase
MCEFLNDLFAFVMETCEFYKIDESHGLGHSMNVYYYATQLYRNTPKMRDKDEMIICVASILHDMCDKKYMKEEEGLERVSNFLKRFPVYVSDEEIYIICMIISTMSYSKVKEMGFPNLGEYMTAYHIVREADLLAAYQFDRCVIYQMMKKGDNYLDSVKYAKDLFDKRVTKHIDHHLFTLEYSKKLVNDMIISYPNF